jgi:SAF domain-containing protein
VALTEPRLATPGVANDPPPRGFRPTSRRRARVAGGVALVAVAIGGNVLVYGSLNQRQSVLQVVRDVPAGQQVTAADVRPIEVDADDTLRSVRADRLPTIVGQFAKVRLVSGSLVVTQALQSTPLVGAGAAVVAIQVPEGALPIGLRERSQVQLVVRGDGDGSAAGVPTNVNGRVVGLPTAPTTATGTLWLSVEVPEQLAATVVASDDVRVVLVQPGTDDAYAADIITGDISTGDITTEPEGP